MPIVRFACVVVSLVAVVACGGDDSGAGTDAAVDAAPIDVASIDGPGVTGPNHAFVVSRVQLPVNAAQAMMLGLDIDDRPNDGVDNQLGMVMGGLDALFPDLQLQAGEDRAIARGEPIVLANLTASSLENGSAALATYEGAEPTPTPCASPQDQNCGRHLQGGATFARGAAATGAPILGSIDGGVFRGSGGEIVFPVAGATSVWVTLHRARAETATIGTLGWSGKLGGAIAMADLDPVVLALAAPMRAWFDADCTPGGNPPACGCVPGSNGEAVRGVFDVNPTDCVITDQEVTAQLAGFLTPDIDLDGDGLGDAISIGVGITAVAATFPAP